MGKNILVVLGGGRPRGNTAQLADAFAHGTSDAGHSVETVSLLKTEVRGCLGCNACRYGRPCVQRDGFNDSRPPHKGRGLPRSPPRCISGPCRHALRRS